MITRQVDMPELTEEQFRIHRAREALHRDGASPAGALELLASLIEDRTWERVTDAAGISYAGRFREFVRARGFGLGFDPQELPKIAQLRHPKEDSQPPIADRMEAMRGEVNRLLKDEIPNALSAVHAGPGRGKKTHGTTMGFNTSGTTVARLKRDDPDLAKRVVAGELSAYAAARQKGWRHPRIVVSTPERVADALRRTMSAQDLALVAKLLNDGDT